MAKVDTRSTFESADFHFEVVVTTWAMIQNTNYPGGGRGGGGNVQSSNFCFVYVKLLSEMKNRKRKSENVIRTRKFFIQNYWCMVHSLSIFMWHSSITFSWEKRIRQAAVRIRPPPPPNKKDLKSLNMTTLFSYFIKRESELLSQNSSGSCRKKRHSNTADFFSRGDIFGASGRDFIGL